jgi:hypothetical protein
MLKNDAAPIHPADESAGILGKIFIIEEYGHKIQIRSDGKLGCTNSSCKNNRELICKHPEVEEILKVD